MASKTPKDQGSDERFILVLGQPGVGKSSFINTISNSTLRIGSALANSQEKVELSLPFFIDGQCFRLIDTPGFDEGSKSDTEVLNTIASFLASEYTNGRKLSGIIYIHSIASNRIGGTGRRNLTIFQKLCGRRAIRNVALVTTRWDQVKQSTATSRENELRTKSPLFKYFLDNGAALFRYDRKEGIQPAQAITRHFINSSPVPLSIQREMVDEGKLLSETAVGIELQKDFRKRMEDSHKTMRQLKEEFHDFKNVNDIAAARDVRQEMISVKEKFDKVRDDCRKLVAIQTANPPMRILISPTPQSAPPAIASASTSKQGTPRIQVQPRSNMNSFSSIPALPPAPPIITSTPVNKGKAKEVLVTPVEPQAQVTFTRPRAPSFDQNAPPPFPPTRQRRDSGRQRPRSQSNPQSGYTHTRVHSHSSRNRRRSKGTEEAWDDLRFFLFFGILLLVLVPFAQRVIEI
ncbi:hypothetical protein H1R20_g2654, partial [Candolleomyces eurysporus]